MVPVHMAATHVRISVLWFFCQVTGITATELEQETCPWSPIVKRPSSLNNILSICNLFILSRLLEGLLNDQAKEFLSAIDILSLSSIRKQHGTIMPSLNVATDKIVSVDHKWITRGKQADRNARIIYRL